MSSPICSSCTELRMRWADSKPSELFQELGIAHGSGAPYDVSRAAIRSRSAARHERWRLLVREQMSAIAEHCRTAGHTGSGDALPPVVQLPLFEFLEAA